MLQPQHQGSSWPSYLCSDSWASKLPAQHLRHSCSFPTFSKGQWQGQMLPRAPELSCLACRIPPCALKSTEQTTHSIRLLGMPPPPHCPGSPEEEPQKLGSACLIVHRHRSWLLLRFRNTQSSGKLTWYPNPIITEKSNKLQTQWNVKLKA